MSSFVIRYVANRLLRDNQWNRLGVEDPFYENVHIGESHGKPKYKKVPRRVPSGLSANDEKVLDQVKKKAHRYDMWFTILGYKVGWANIIGIIPVVGSIVQTYWLLSLFVAARGLDEGLPLDIQLLFLLNILIDFALSLIPIVGDLIEVGYKANSRNFLLLEKHLHRVGDKNLGLIGPDDVRPGFINDRIQPIVEDKIVPSVAKASDSVRVFVSKQLHSHLSSGTSSPERYTSSPTIQTSPTTITSATTANAGNVRKRQEKDDNDSRSVRSVRSLSSNLAQDQAAADEKTA